MEIRRGKRRGKIESVRRIEKEREGDGEESKEGKER